MSPRADLRVFAGVIVLVALANACLAGEIRKGATMQVKADSIWFQDAEKFARWQSLKKGGDTKALAAYQEEALRQRDAWQFTKPLAVKIRGVTPKANRVDVEMMTEGRLQGSRWLLDIDAIDAKGQ
ncbi:MAG TPA: hypothetical protein VL305_03150 [Pseudolabrys sp.]|jgi:hypothetical protein|nr:hypothetical protein [Pseudolabrys sp.]